MARQWTRQLPALSLAGFLAACGGGAPPETAPPPAAAPAAAAPAATTESAPATEEGAAYEVAPVTDGGTVAGKVTLTGTAPAPEKVEVTKDNNACGNEKVMENVKVSPAGTVANAVVWIDGVAKGKDWAKKDGAIDQKECHYVPHMQAVPVGGTLEIMNSDPVLHNIHAYSSGDTLFNIAQPTQGQKTPKKLSKGGPIEFKCDVHGWMHAWVFVASNPYFAVTGDDGAFSIGELPAGSYKLKVWHETFGTKDMDVTVAAAGTATADFALAAQ
jgi:plastocyanin